MLLTPVSLGAFRYASFFIINFGYFFCCWSPIYNYLGGTKSLQRCVTFLSLKFNLEPFLLQLLDRVFNILRENNPDLAGDRRRTVMRPPQVLRGGTKKTVFVNFMDLCKT